MSIYLKLTSAEGGEWPADHVLTIGSVIRVDSMRSPRPGPVFNNVTSEWVSPRWTEVSDPREES